MMTPTIENKIQESKELALKVSEWERRGGKIKHCTSADNANYYGLPVTPSMSQRKRSSGGKPMHINVESFFANT